MNFVNSFPNIQCYSCCDFDRSTTETQKSFVEECSKQDKSPQKETQNLNQSYKEKGPQSTNLKRTQRSYIQQCTKHTTSKTSSQLNKSKAEKVYLTASNSNRPRRES